MIKSPFKKNIYYDQSIFLQYNWMKMRSIPKDDFYKTKYGSGLLTDVVEFKHIKRFLN